MNLLHFMTQEEVILSLSNCSTVYFGFRIMMMVKNTEQCLMSSFMYSKVISSARHEDDIEYIYTLQDHLVKPEGLASHGQQLRSAGF